MSEDRDATYWKRRYDGKCEEFAQSQHLLELSGKQALEWRAELAAAQSRVELLEHDMKSGDYETLYAQTVEELETLRDANAKVRQDTIEKCAKVCDDITIMVPLAWSREGKAGHRECARKIRALGRAVPVQQELRDHGAYAAERRNNSGRRAADRKLTGA